MSVPDHFWFRHLVCEKNEVLRFAVITASSLLSCLRLYLPRQLGYEKVTKNLSKFLLRKLQFFESIRVMLLLPFLSVSQKFGGSFQ